MMFYKTILVHVDSDAPPDRHVEVAAMLAAGAGAHLIGMAATGVAQGLHATAPAAAPGPGTLREHARAALDRFEARARSLGATSCTHRLVDDDAAVALGRHSLYADLVVLGQGGSGAGSAAAGVDFAEYVVLNSPCPVLIVPRAAPGPALCERALVAWNGSRAAARAVRDALPLLQRAGRVQLALVDTTTANVALDDAAAGELLAFLERHGIVAEIVRRRAQGDAGHGLLALASELDAGLLVMGCVAHPRTRSMALGGATRVALQSATLQVLMSH